ncbi:hypothetical protein [Cryobacterium sp. Y50]|uniref:hypothetical protein n=1 Tax=Cryobacterium sp. Y50 TaxID=2048286 RepID=UPI000CE36155|nr:hypothetical protein [Cryobacterium sp. Y50]
MIINDAITDFSNQLTTTRQKLALNDLMHELNSRQLLPRDTIVTIWKQWAHAAASPPVRAGSAGERAEMHTERTHAEKSPVNVKDSSGSLPTRGSIQARAIPRDPRNPDNRRSRLLSGYGAALESIGQQVPEAVQPIRVYVSALRDECARARVRARALRAQLERGNQ